MHAKKKISWVTTDNLVVMSKMDFLTSIIDQLRLTEYCNIFRNKTIEIPFCVHQEKNK